MASRGKKTAAKPSDMAQRIRELQLENSKFIASQSEVKRFAELERQLHNKVNRSNHQTKISEQNISNASPLSSPRRSATSKFAAGSSSSFAVSRMLKMEDLANQRNRNSSVDKDSLTKRSDASGISPRSHVLSEVSGVSPRSPRMKPSESASVPPSPSRLSALRKAHTSHEARLSVAPEKIVFSRSVGSAVTKKRPGTVTQAFSELDPFLGGVTLSSTEEDISQPSQRKHFEYDPELVEQHRRSSLGMKRSSTRGGRASGTGSSLAPIVYPNMSAPPKQKRTRILADKLSEFSFIKELFNERASLREAQGLVNQLEDILYLLDAEQSGFVPWESFTKVLLSVAPKHLMRRDILTFLDSQCEDSQDLIDYREFIIAGKLNIVKRYFTEELPVAAWTERQKMYTGEVATYTWKNHVRWFIKRRSEAVIWLMRRATRAVVQFAYKGAADVFLQRQGKIARAYTYLREMGWMAMETDRRRREAKARLVARCLHSKKNNQIKDEAARYLKFKAQGANIVYQHTVQQQERTLANVYKRTGEQANYNIIFELYYLQTTAQKWLKARAGKAVEMSARQDAALLSLSTHAQKILTQMILQSGVFEELIAAGERARDICYEVDKAFAFLSRLGVHSRTHADNKEQAFAWLVNKGKESVRYEAEYWEQYDWLAAKGRWALYYINSRKRAGEYLRRRRELANKLMIDKRDALMFLRRIPRMIFARQGFVDSTYDALVNRGRRALLFVENKEKAFRYLKRTAVRAAVTRRKMALAQLYLQQKGAFAKFKTFTDLHLPLEKVKLEEEKKRVVNKDKKVNDLRNEQYTLPEQRWHAELEDAFTWMDMMCPVPKPEDSKAPITLSWFGFQRIMLNGALLNIKPETLMEDFKVINVDRSGFVSFDDVWDYVLPKAQRRNGREPSPLKTERPDSRASRVSSPSSPQRSSSPSKSVRSASPSKTARSRGGFFSGTSRGQNFMSKNGYRFLLNDIFSVDDRATITLYLRFLNPQLQGKKASDSGSMNMMMYGGLGKRKLPPVMLDESEGD